MTVAQLDANYIRLMTDLRSRVVGLMERQFLSLPNYWQVNEDAFVRAAVPLIVGAQRTTATVTVAWLRARLLEETGRSVPSSVNLAPIAKGLRGVPSTDLYRRPFVQTRYTWKEGATVTAAVAAGRLRLLALASTDLQLAHTTAASDFIQRTDPNMVKGYRRVTTSKEPCPLCIKAADWHYYRGDLLPIHDNCHCIVVPALVAPSRQTKVAGADGTLTDEDKASLAALVERSEALGHPISGVPSYAAPTGATAVA